MQQHVSTCAVWNVYIYKTTTKYICDKFCNNFISKWQILLWLSRETKDLMKNAVQFSLLIYFYLVKHKLIKTKVLSCSLSPGGIKCFICIDQPEQYLNQQHSHNPCSHLLCSADGKQLVLSGISDLLSARVEVSHVLHFRNN